MTRFASWEDSHDVSPACPAWCVVEHGVRLGEEDWLHTGEPVVVADGMMARLCMSVQPDTGIEDGPYVLIGGCELTLAETGALATTLLAMAGSDGGLSRRRPAAT